MKTEQTLPRQALRMAQVLERIGCSRTHLYTMIAKGEFPDGHKISERIKIWDAVVVDNWIKEKMNRAKK